MEVADTGELRPPELGAMPTRARTRTTALVAALVVAAALPLVGLISLLLRSRLDPHFENYRLHFVVFGIVGGLAFTLGYAAGEAANRRGDARVLLLSLAFMATGGFLAVHALGTPSILFSEEYAGFQVAIPVGLLVASVFAAGSAFVDVRPGFGAWLIRRRAVLRLAVLLSIGLWFIWSVGKLPILSGPGTEAAKGGVLAMFAIAGTAVYAVSAARYLSVFRHRLTLLPLAVIGCFVLLAEALIGVALTGERSWHASWWEWHGLIVAAYLLIGFAVRREWRDERFRDLYLATTRERHQEISVLFGDLVGFTSFAERSTPAEAAAVLDAYWGAAAPLIARRFGGELEKFIGDAMMATFNRRGDQPDHALRAARAALELQREARRLIKVHPDWPRLRIGVNSGTALVAEVGGEGYVAYPFVGDTVNTASRLEELAPVGGVLVGSDTYERLPSGAVVETRGELRVKGKENAVQAYVLHSVP
jgi:class 3 adenylate cyclase